MDLNHSNHDELCGISRVIHKDDQTTVGLKPPKHGINAVPD